MSQTLRKPMSPSDYLVWEACQSSKWEFDGFRPVAMTGGSDAHSAIQGNLLTALNNRLRGQPCRPRGPDLKVQAGSSYRYPDALVTCTPIPPDATIAAAPVVIFEILSKSTERGDRTVKLREYRSLPSLQRYVLLEQDQALATVYTRSGDVWTVDQLDDGQALALPEIGIDIPVAEFYADVALPDPATFETEGR